MEKGEWKEEGWKMKIEVRRTEDGKGKRERRGKEPARM
jgi:hypothetical protein